MIFFWFDKTWTIIIDYLIVQEVFKEYVTQIWLAADIQY